MQQDGARAAAADPAGPASPPRTADPPSKRQRGLGRKQVKEAFQRAEQAPQPGASDNFTVSGGHSSSALASAAAHSQQWQATTTSLVGDLAACGWCGRAALGGDHSVLRANMRTCPHEGGLPPAALANPWMAELMCPPGEEGQIWACGACRGSTPAAVSRRAKQLELQPSVVPPSATDDAARAAAIGEWATLAADLVALPAGAAMHLAVLRCGVRYARRIHGYVHTQEATGARDLLQGPLMLWDQQVGRSMPSTTLLPRCRPEGCMLLAPPAKPALPCARPAAGAR